MLEMMNISVMRKNSKLTLKEKRYKTQFCYIVIMRLKLLIVVEASMRVDFLYWRLSA
ncbi:hypothetical protein Gotri_022424 [Gossypium trilobum]|uniref:Uncharacterized protein n=1 Tax=Gossypium trilobum TaxID=34281 RepID=A0A7J9DFS0_9ROSI|nr:hypothetical protein [Gossypium trilobum]